MNNQFDLSDLLHQMHDWGFMFFPIWPNTKDPACSSWKKIEHHMSPVDVIDRIKKGSNYAIIPPEGVFVIDFDSDEAYQRGIEKASIIADSLTFKTPKGYHVLFVGDGVPQTASPIKEDPKKPRSPKTFLGKGVDVRVGGTVDSAKGYIVGPGSTRDGKRYEYLSGDEILDAPPELISLLQKPKTWKEVTGQDSPVDAPRAPTAPPDSATGITRPLTIQERGKAARKHWKALEDAQEGERNDTIARAACGLGSLYADADDDKRNEIFAKLMDHAERLGDGDPSEIKQNRTTAENQWLKGAESPASRPDNSESEDTYRMVFSKFDIHEFERALSNLNITVRDNQETDKVEFRIVDDCSWPIPKAFRFKIGEWFVADRKTNNSIIGNITRYFGRQKGEHVVSVTLPETKFSVWRDTLAGENPARPFHHWVENLPHISIPEELTLENWMQPWLKHPDTPLNRWIQRAMIVGIIQKIYSDLQACRIIPVLRGEKGIGKTTLVTELVPIDFRHMFGQFQVQSRKSEMVGSLRSKFLCEAGEFAMDNRQVDVFKSFIGTSVHSSRQPYEPEYQDYENTAFIIGTTNPERNIPNDVALLSRLAFMDLVEGPDPKEYLPSRLPVLYALGRESYLTDGGVGVLPKSLVQEQQEASAESIIVNQVMDDRLRSLDWRLIGAWFTVTDILLAAGLISNRQRQNPSGAVKAVRDLLIELGVGTNRSDMRKKGPGGVWHYHESEKIRRIRKDLIREHGNMPPQYGYKVQRITNDLSAL